ncbi:hypothetical protein [Candidatus Pantoea soli]|uniref:Secreted protein n=1 Tax=Candidatus Pantoea soli TaxID=3098669 RepID=A0A518XAC1_9GAMM|nr:hypothetical protein [Pantoea soli]QDY41145.1 hypothetical protein D8B20_04200 [Pantoea soli]
MKNVVKGLLLTLLLSPLAQASSEEAWQQNARNGQQACLKASGLKAASIVGKPVQYDDSVGYDALLLEGRYPQKHMKNQKGRELCLYQRQSGKAVVSEADQLRVAQ